jgi:hypothetical protein
MKGLFVGMTESELLALRDTARSAAASGTAVTSFSAPGLSGSNEVTAKPDEILMEVLYALQKLDPDTYGRSLTITRTHARFV